MEARLKEALKTTTLRSTGKGGGGCINEGECFQTDSGEVFIKRNSKKEARRMFEGESAALTAIHETNTVRVPKPIAVSMHVCMQSLLLRHCDVHMKPCVLLISEQACMHI